MLDVKQQKVFQESMLLSESDITDFTGLEVSVACVFFQVAASEICVQNAYRKIIAHYISLYLNPFLAN